MKRMALAILLLAGQSTYAASAHRCAADAIGKAEKLLEFHVGSDDPLDIDKSVKVLTPIRNPANAKQKFDVLEVRGSVYKGQYRMRFLYAQLPGDCLLMGQEILAHASL